jgi:hypothetical protein
VRLTESFGYQSITLDLQSNSSPTRATSVLRI